MEAKEMKLSDAELEIMEKVWELGAPVTAAQLTERMAEKGWKPSTLLTFLARMVNK
ncbi:BlaI/MecI/CopY family transcriptional regulator, partial [Candidatus Allofournierella excrementavium]|uniref:BlaI/MecI/CopY family transcriptional regulator n=1 Tax=Candidatus Allofournierella excrementavium TaxID=2838591 RepID=UPI003A849009